MKTDSSSEESDFARSCFVRSLVQRSADACPPGDFPNTRVQKRIVQFWHDSVRLPEDVRACIESWTSITDQGIDHSLFDQQQAQDFISQKLGDRYVKAFTKCYHPAMQSDYFRLCYIFLEGGCYVDTDDVFTGSQILHLFDDGRLKIQPLCYDKESHSMVPLPRFLSPTEYSEQWIFYFNNNPLIACKEHPIVERALFEATKSLEQPSLEELPEIQSTTGPGNLTKSIFYEVRTNVRLEQSIMILRDWDSIAINKWDLGYRNDVRNWRLSNRRAFQD